MVRAAADKPGVLYAFIVLDNPANSILDMQVRRWASCRWGARQRLVSRLPVPCTRPQHVAWVLRAPPFANKRR